MLPQQPKANKWRPIAGLTLSAYSISNLTNHLFNSVAAFQYTPAFLDFKCVHSEHRFQVRTNWGCHSNQIPKPQGCCRGNIYFYPGQKRIPSNGAHSSITVNKI